MNQVSLTGRLTKDPELRYITTGDAISSFTLAVNRPFKSQSGENTADFISCVAFRRQAELITQYCQKGSQIGVEGRIQTRSWDGQDGKRQYRTDVVVERVEFLSRSKKQEEAPEEPESTSEDESVPF